MMTTRTAAARHVPVLRARVVELLIPACSGENPVYVDATLGMAGHAEAMLSAAPTLRLVGIDRDEQALALARQRLEPFADRVDLVHAVYDEVGEVLDGLGIASADAVLFDLGVSSLQLDETERGFAYSVDAPLDMRMDPSRGPTAADVLAGYPEAELVRILHEFGEERFAKRVAAAIVRERQTAPITRSGRLVQILSRAIPAATQRTGGHPAKRTFQALRIEVNRELEAWRRALPGAIERLAVGGRVAVLSYHSLEDRIAKQAFAAGSRSSTPADLPVELPGHAPYLRLLTRGAETAPPDEVDENPRAASVRLRAAERIRPGGGPS